MADLLARSLLIRPALAARAAARTGSAGQQQRWMLHRPQAVPASYLREMLEPNAR